MSSTLAVIVVVVVLLLLALERTLMGMTMILGRRCELVVIGRY